MNRRGFLGTLIGGVAAGAAVRSWPFRVYSFPSEPKIIDVTAEISRIAKTFEQYLNGIMYGDGVSTYGMGYLEAPASTNFVNLERSIYPGKIT